MEGRMRMAMFDHNHHVHRSPQLKQDGTIQYKRQYSNKGKRWVAMVVKEPKSYSYFKPLLAVILHQRLLNKSWIRGQVPKQSGDPIHLAPTIAPVMPAETQTIVTLHKSRFGN